MSECASCCIPEFHIALYSFWRFETQRNNTNMTICLLDTIFLFLALIFTRCTGLYWPISHQTAPYLLFKTTSDIVGWSISASENRFACLFFRVTLYILTSPRLIFRELNLGLSVFFLEKYGLVCLFFLKIYIIVCSFEKYQGLQTIFPENWEKSNSEKQTERWQTKTEKLHTFLKKIDSPDFLQMSSEGHRTN